MKRWLTAAAAIGAGAWLARGVRPEDPIGGEVALVTGGSRGLGYLLAERLMEQGCRVVICARDEETLERARRKLREHPGGDLTAIPCDVSDPDAVRAMVREILERFGALHIVVNNASIIQMAPLETLEVEDFRKAVDINFMGTVHCTLAALPHMRARGRGRIVNITSIGGKVAVPHLLPYDCGKFAAVGFSEGLRAEVAKDGIRVTTVVPGLMRTGSPVHVEYRGQPDKEYRWFAPGDLLPMTSMPAEQAADRIVRALRRGDAEVVLSWQARLLRVAHALSPGGMSRFLGLVNRLLPEPDGARSARGRDMPDALPGPVDAALRRAGRRTNQGVEA